MTLVIFSLVLGGLLAQRYSVLALPPATLLIVISWAMFGTSATPSIWSIIAMVMTAALSMQVGYFIGLAWAHRTAVRTTNKLSVYTHSTSTQKPAG